MSFELVAVKIGYSITIKNKLGTVFVVVPREQFEKQQPLVFNPETDRILLADKKSRKYGKEPMGAVYGVIEFEVNKSIQFGKYLGLWWNEQDRLLWRTDGIGVGEEYRRLREKMKDQKDNPLRGVCAPLRELYLRTPYPHRPAVLGAMLYEITRGG